MHATLPERLSKGGRAQTLKRTRSCERPPARAAHRAQNTPTSGAIAPPRARRDPPRRRLSPRGRRRRTRGRRTGRSCSRPPPCASA
jgi:hypothetical protein